MKRIVAFFLLALLAVMGCTRKVQYTTVEIRDPVRHYYPILQGQELTVLVRLENKGKVPLVIKDIQPSCGCIVLESDHEMVVPPERNMLVTLKYDSRKNVGRAEHSVRFWGNISPSTRRRAPGCSRNSWTEQAMKGAWATMWTADSFSQQSAVENFSVKFRAGVLY